jgi:hypothetical protein
MLRQLLQQRFGLLKVGSVKALREPTIHRGKQVVGSFALPVLLPQLAETDGCPQLQRLGVLVTGDT